MIRWNTLEAQRAPGFRLNRIDVAVLITLGAASAALYRVDHGSGVFALPAYVGVSFFLFCNVFRIGNRLEPFWYVPFVLYVLADLADGELGWTRILLIFEPLKVVLVLYRVWAGPYVGVLHERVNAPAGRPGPDQSPR